MNEQQNTGRVSRRMLLKRAATLSSGLAVMALLESCGGSSSATPTPGRSVTSSGSSAAPTAASPATAATVSSASSAVASSGGQSGKPGGKLLYARTTETPDLNVHAGNLAAHRVMALVYDTLLRTDRDLKIIPGLAERWEAPDPTTYVFHLRKDVKWHNGRSFEAADVKFNYEWMLDPKNAASRRADLAVVDRIDAPDKETVRITLKSPSGGFLALIADMFFAILPRELLESGEFRQKAVGTGPFKLDSWAKDNKMELVRNPDYYIKDRPYLDGMTVQIIPAEDSIVAGLRGGSVMQTTFEDNKNYLPFKDNANFNALRTPRIGMEFVVINNLIPPFDNEKVRQALAYAVDRQEIMQASLQGLGRLTGPLPSALTEWALPPDAFDTYKPNPAKAKALLTEAGHPNGFKTDLMIIPTFPTFVAASQVIAAQLRKVGIDVNIVQVEYALWLDRLNKAKDMPLTINSTQGVIDPDPYIYGRFHSKGFNQANWNQPEVDALLEQGRAETDQAKRKDIYQRIQRLLADVKVPYIWLYSADLVDVSQKYVQGYQPYPSSFLFGMADTWLSK